MSKFREYIGRFENEIIIEMAETRGAAKAKVNDLGYEIHKHLVKILFWEDEVNYNKHLNDIDTWLLKIDRLKLKPNKKPKAKDFYEWLYENENDDKYALDITINKVLKKYHNLPRTDITQNQLFITLRDIYKKLSLDLSQEYKFKSIRDYL